MDESKNDLLSRLDRVGVHQSVTARYCKEAAAEIRRLQAALDRLVLAADCRENTMGDPIRLLQVREELAAAANNARATITKLEAQS